MKDGFQFTVKNIIQLTLAVKLILTFIAIIGQCTSGYNNILDIINKAKEQ